MSNNYLRFGSLAAVLYLASGAWGQVPEVDSVKGELHVDSPGFIHSELTLSDLRGAKVAEASAGADGRFEFRHVPYGDYRLTVANGGGQTVHEELLSVRNQMLPIQIEVAMPEAESSASATISAQELLHPPAKKAVRACIAAEKLAQAGAHDKAAEQLEKAIQLSPDYTAAWINLGAQHIYLRQYEKALQELTHASELSKPTAMVLSNMAFAQFSLHRFGEGIRCARAALRLEPSSAQAHYLLGAALVRDERTRTEGLQHLELAARTLPSAQAELDRARRESAQVVTRP